MISCGKAVINMHKCFVRIKILKIIFLNGFNTKDVTDMWHMFCGCYRLSSLDLSNLNTSNVKI